MPSLSGKTRILGILGNPVSHSLSPVMQNAAIAACNLDYVYVPFSVQPEYLGAAVKGMRALDICGFNVTIPYKTAIMSHLDEIDDSASAAGAVNTVLFRDGLLTGYNTDGYGLVTSLAEDLNFAVGSVDGTIIVIGAGGAARGALSALCSAGAARIVIVNRSLSRAVALAEEMNSRYAKTCILVSSPEQISTDYLGSASLLVNTTSLGMNSDRIAFIDLGRLPQRAKIYDMVYSPAETPLLREASSLGIEAVNGLGMLAAQGEKSFIIWTGISPPKGLMKRVLQSVCRP